LLSDYNGVIVGLGLEPGSLMTNPVYLVLLHVALPSPCRLESALAFLDGNREHRRTSDILCLTLGSIYLTTYLLSDSCMMFTFCLNFKKL
jgi:hypothetical protein